MRYLHPMWHFHTRRREMFSALLVNHKQYTIVAVVVVVVADQYSITTCMFHVQLDEKSRKPHSRSNDVWLCVCVWVCVGVDAVSTMCTIIRWWFELCNMLNHARWLCIRDGDVLITLKQCIVGWLALIYGGRVERFSSRWFAERVCVYVGAWWSGDAHIWNVYTHERFPTKRPTPEPNRDMHERIETLLYRSKWIVLIRVVYAAFNQTARRIPTRCAIYGYVYMVSVNRMCYQYGT